MVKSIYLGQIPNLKGRKSAILRCGCCTAYNPKEKYLKREHEKLMRAAKHGLIDLLDITNGEETKRR